MGRYSTTRQPLKVRHDLPTQTHCAPQPLGDRRSAGHDCTAAVATIPHTHFCLHYVAHARAADESSSPHFEKIRVHDRVLPVKEAAAKDEWTKKLSAQLKKQKEEHDEQEDPESAHHMGMEVAALFMLAILVLGLVLVALILNREMLY